MFKYNKFNIGDIVGHNESPSLEFRITSVLCAVEDTPGDYLYNYDQVFDEEEPADIETIYEYPSSGAYHEADLFFIRKGTVDELNRMLESVKNQTKWFETLSKEIQRVRSEA